MINITLSSSHLISLSPFFISLFTFRLPVLVLSFHLCIFSKYSPDMSRITVDIMTPMRVDGPATLAKEYGIMMKTDSGIQSANTPNGILKIRRKSI